MIQNVSVCLIPILLTGCAGGGEDNLSAIASICTTLVECGAIAETDTATCEVELDLATPDSATRAADECAACLGDNVCADVDDGKCTEICEPFFESSRREPGQVTQPCEDMSTLNYATKANGGSLLVVVAGCSQPDRIRVLPGAHFDVGTVISCGRMIVEQIGGDDECEQAVGELSIVAQGGRKRVVGNCSCSNHQVSFDVPYRYSF